MFVRFLQNISLMFEVQRLSYKSSKLSRHLKLHIKRYKKNNKPTKVPANRKPLKQIIMYKQIFRRLTKFIVDTYEQ